MVGARWRAVLARIALAAVLSAQPIQVDKCTCHCSSIAAALHLDQYISETIEEYQIMRSSRISIPSRKIPNLLQCSLNNVHPVMILMPVIYHINQV
jgi:hypothetical protein